MLLFITESCTFQLRRIIVMHLSKNQILNFADQMVCFTAKRYPNAPARMPQIYCECKVVGCGDNNVSIEMNGHWLLLPIEIFIGMWRLQRKVSTNNNAQVIKRYL